MKNVKELVELRDRAYEGGVELKNAIVTKTGKTVHDYMYVRADKMIQAMHYGRNNEFMDNVIKLSNMFELPIPRPLLEGMADEEKFNVVSRSYMIGLLS